jgi:hypothetical protein
MKILISLLTLIYILQADSLYDSLKKDSKQKKEYKTDSNYKKNSYLNKVPKYKPKNKLEYSSTSKNNIYNSKQYDKAISHEKQSALHVDPNGNFINSDPLGTDSPKEYKIHYNLK